MTFMVLLHVILSTFLRVILSASEESRWLNPDITAFKIDTSSPAAPQDDTYDTFSVILNGSSSNNA